MKTSDKINSQGARHLMRSQAPHANPVDNPFRVADTYAEKVIVGTLMAIDSISYISPFRWIPELTRCGTDHTNSAFDASSHFDASSPANKDAGGGGGIVGETCIADGECASSHCKEGICVPECSELPEPLTIPCEPGETQGECRIGTREIRCENEEIIVGECVEKITPSQERCDNKDNDCDGVTDQLSERTSQECSNGQERTRDCTDGQWSEWSDCEGAICKTGDAIVKPCGETDEGECQKGIETLICENNDFVPDGNGCIGETGPVEEVCNALDDDCDGQTDEEILPLQGYSGPPGTENVGFCQGFYASCIEGFMRYAAMEFTPRNELCNSIDDDCDGQTDEADDLNRLLGFFTCGKGICEHDIFFTCIEGSLQWPFCDSSEGAMPELCNDLDDDCDGDVDNGFLEELFCPVGEGDCFNPNIGIVYCSEDHSEAICSVTPLPSQPEVCDGRDNDCDGETDEELGITTCGFGICEHTVDNCVDGALNVCDPREGVGVEFYCDDNALDDDCDGETDEGVGDLCYIPVNDCLRRGAIACSPEWGAMCSGTPEDPPFEICDGIDNDCDGTIDNVFGTGTACSVGTGACSREGETACLPDKTVGCNMQPGTPIEESCNGIDDDCDGQTDEAIVDVVPIVQKPTDGILLAPTRAFLSWGLPNVDPIILSSYKMCWTSNIDEFETFEDPAQCPNSTIVPEQSFHVLDLLERDADYRWKVAAICNEGMPNASPFSATQTFSTDDSIIGWWKFDESQSGIEPDWSGYGHNGSWQDGYWVPNSTFAPPYITNDGVCSASDGDLSINNIIGGAACADGVDDRMGIGNSPPPISFSDALSMIARVRPGIVNNSSVDGRILLGGSSFCTFYGLSIGPVTDASTRMSFAFFDNGPPEQNWSRCTFSNPNNYCSCGNLNDQSGAGAWHFLAGAYDRSEGEMNCYMDDQPAHNTTCALPISNSTYGTNLWSGPDRTFPGLLDELIFSNRGLPAEVIQNNQCAMEALALTDNESLPSFCR